MPDIVATTEGMLATLGQYTEEGEKAGGETKVECLYLHQSIKRTFPKGDQEGDC